MIWMSGDVFSAFKSAVFSHVVVLAAKNVTTGKEFPASKPACTQNKTGHNQFIFISEKQSIKIS